MTVMARLLEKEDDPNYKNRGKTNYTGLQDHLSDTTMTGTWFKLFSFPETKQL